MIIITQENKKINRRDLSSICIRGSNSLANPYSDSVYGVVKGDEILLGRYKTYNEAFEKLQLVLESPRVSFLGKEIHM